MTTDTGNPANVTMRTCHWCEDIHPEHLSVSWFPGRAYFCTDGCYQEWVEQAGEQP